MTFPVRQLAKLTQTAEFGHMQALEAMDINRSFYQLKPRVKTNIVREDMPEWLQKSCTKCGGAVMYLAHWSVLPKHCDNCKIIAISGLSLCLQQFLDHEANIAKRVFTSDERTAYAGRKQLREKVQVALIKSGSSQDALRRICTEDKQLSKLVLRISKERKLQDRKVEPRGLIPKHIAPFLQGGAPGLGKRS